MRGKGRGKGRHLKKWTSAPRKKHEKSVPPSVVLVNALSTENWASFIFATTSRECRSFGYEYSEVTMWR